MLPLPPSPRLPFFRSRTIRDGRGTIFSVVVCLGISDTDFFLSLFSLGSRKLRVFLLLLVETEGGMDLFSFRHDWRFVVVVTRQRRRF